MALALDLEKYGTTFTNAYHKINVVGSNVQSGYTIIVNVYYDATASANGEEALTTKTYSLEWVEGVDDGSSGYLDYHNPIEFGYGLLKTLPEYATATDV